MKPIKKKCLMLLFFCVIMPFNYALENNQSEASPLGNDVTIANNNNLETELPIVQRYMLLFKEWLKKLTLNYNKENLQSIREELNEIYNQLGDSYKQAHNTRQLAQELPALTDKIGKNLEALALYSKSFGLKANDKETVHIAIKETTDDLINLKNELSDTMVDKTIKATIDAQINNALTTIGFKKNN